MQEPLMRATPQPANQNAMLPNAPNQRVDRNVLNLYLLRARGGWYPRWWLLSALFCSVIIGAGMLLWSPVICPIGPHLTRAPICVLPTWPFPIQVALIWLLFGILGFAAFVLGVGPIEVPRLQRHRIAIIFMSISQFGPLRWLLFIQGGIALLLILIMWVFDHSPPVAFGILSIVVFLANSALLYHRSPDERRLYLIGYGVLALSSIILEIVLKRYITDWTLPPPDEQPLLFTELVLIGVAIRAFFWRPQPNIQLTAQEALEQNIAGSSSPLYVLRSMWPFNRILPNRPLNNPVRPGNAPPGTR